MALRIDLTGMKFGRLTAVAWFSGGRNPMWTFRCDCGTVINRSSGHVKNGNTSSCGCLKKDLSRLPAGESGLNKLLSEYKRAARDRNYNWELTKEQFKELTSKNCYFCDIEPLQIKSAATDSTYSAEGIKHGAYKYNGIDRLENDKGYTSENCVPCCGICNNMKRDLPPNEFLDKCIKIANNLLK